MTTYSYDANNNLTTRAYPDGSLVTFSYDSINQQTRMEDVTGRYTYSYDDNGRRKSVVSPSNKTITYTYDAVGNRSSMLDPDGGRFSYTYDSDDQLTSLINPQNNRITNTYDAVGKKSTQHLANGIRTSFIYNAANQTTDIIHRKSDRSVINSFAYTYNAANNRTSIIEASGDRTTYTYDSTNQLESEHRAGPSSPAPFRTTYTYDPTGNRTQQQVESAVTTYMYNTVNQLLTSADISGTTTFTYDNDGNQLTSETSANALTTNTWSYENRLTQIELPSSDVVTYTYGITRRSGEEMRVKKDDGSNVAKYIWDEANIITETDESNTPTAIFTYDPETYGNLISMLRGTDASFYHFDALGSTLALTDSSELITDSYLYDAFGEIIDSSGTTINPYQFVGQVGYYFNADTNYHTTRLRELDTEYGRFVSFDPIYFAGGDVNLYRYVNNNPVINVDPSGLLWGPVGWLLPDPIEIIDYSLPDQSCESCMPDFHKCVAKAWQHLAACKLGKTVPGLEEAGCIILCSRWVKSPGHAAVCAAVCALGQLGVLALYVAYICPDRMNKELSTCIGNHNSCIDDNSVGPGRNPKTVDCNGCGKIQIDQ